MSFATCIFMSHGASNIVQHWLDTCLLVGQVLGVEVRKQKEFLHGDAFQRPEFPTSSASSAFKPTPLSIWPKHI